MVAVVSIFAALFTLVEYTSQTPSIVEFRNAPPFNRVRFSALFATVFSLSVIFRGNVQPSALTDLFQKSAAQLGLIAELPLSPIQLMVAAVSDQTGPVVLQQLKDAASLGYVMLLLSLISFLVLLRLREWPRQGAAYPLWDNLPTFDPTAYGDVVKRLRRDGRVNILLGLVLPFVIPLIVKLAGHLGLSVPLDDPHVLIWTVAAWIFLPAGILMRGVAVARVARMIELQRKRGGSHGLLHA